MARGRGAKAVAEKTRRSKDPFAVEARFPFTCACRGRDPSCRICDGVARWEILMGKDSSPSKPSLTEEERAARWFALPEYEREQKRLDRSVQRAAAAMPSEEDRAQA